MDAVVFEGSPLADYLEGEGDGDKEWLPAQEPENSHLLPSTSFAPRGRPSVQSKFRSRLPQALRINVPPNTAVAVIHNTCSKALNSRLGRADNTRFLERFRYIIVASQLLTDHAYHGQSMRRSSQSEPSLDAMVPQLGAFTTTGAALTALTAFILVWMIDWARGGSNLKNTAGRASVLITIFAIVTTVSYTYMRRQWLQYLRQQTLMEATSFVTKAQELDAAIAGSITLIQEVELVSRGYRVSSPLPPITRLEDRSQTRRCLQLRRALRDCMLTLLPRYNQACVVMKPLTELRDLEKYYDVYDVNELDLQEAALGYVENEFEDAESLRVLKILVARFHTIRKVFLCCLLALEADGGKPDFFRWSTAVDEVQALAIATADSGDQMDRILGEETNFPIPGTPKVPLTPSRERWRAQLRKLGTLSTGIRGLQAKMHVLREESDRTLNESVDLSELGPNLMIQYDSIGVDLRALIQEWEAGKAALANNIDRNERRISSMSGMLSPTISLGGLTSVDEGSPTDALKALNGGGNRYSMDFGSSDSEEVFEAIALPRQRSTLTRDERIVKMKEDRVKRESMRDKAEANTHMLRELESVINLRPRGKTAPGAAPIRVTSI